jgi:hypothetical protein
MPSLLYFLLSKKGVTIIMPWICSVVKNSKQANEPGHMWQADNSHWLVVLPNGGLHDINAVFSDGSSWNVTGDAPKLTVSPSIRRYDIPDGKGGVWKKGWHGWITDGIMSDDCEGRTYSREEGIPE